MGSLFYQVPSPPNPSWLLSDSLILLNPTWKTACHLSVAPLPSDICTSAPTALDSESLKPGNRLSSLPKSRQRLELGVFGGWNGWGSAERTVEARCLRSQFTGSTSRFLNAPGRPLLAFLAPYLESRWVGLPPLQRSFQRQGSDVVCECACMHIHMYTRTPGF